MSILEPIKLNRGKRVGGKKNLDKNCRSAILEIAAPCDVPLSTCYQHDILFLKEAMKHVLGF